MLFIFNNVTNSIISNAGNVRAHFSHDLTHDIYIYTNPHILFGQLCSLAIVTQIYNVTANVTCIITFFPFFFLRSYLV